jgi:hypothetical protein
MCLHAHTHTRKMLDDYLMFIRKMFIHVLMRTYILMSLTKTQK